MRKGSTVADTTALDGNDMDAVAASLLDGPPKDVEETPEELEQATAADAEDQTEGDEADADEAEADEDDSEDEGEADAEEGDKPEQLFTVKVDGRDQQVPLSELLRGYSGQAYIQQGMQQVAQARQAVEQIYTALQSERQQIAQFVQAAQTGQMPMQPPKAPDDAMLKTDPIGYLEARVQYDKDLAAYQQAQLTARELSTRQAQAEEQARLTYLADQHRQLAQAIPAFAKPETAKALKQELLTTGREVYGFAEQELRAVTDMRVIRALHDAAMYRRLMAGKPAAEKPAQRAPQTPPIKPGAKQPPQQGKTKRVEQAKAQMKRTGSVDDVARFLLM